MLGDMHDPIYPTCISIPGDITGSSSSAKYLSSMELWYPVGLKLVDTRVYSVFVSI
jgi:hypothetical protein